MVIAGSTGGNSIFRQTEIASDFFWDFWAAAMALQRQQGCLPSKVLHTAWAKQSPRRFFANMAVQATLCNAAQCRPVVRTTTATTRTFPKRTNTRITYPACAEAQARIENDYFSEIHTSVPLASRSNKGIKSESARKIEPCEAGLPTLFWSLVPCM